MEFVAGYEEEANAAADLPAVTVLPFDGALWWGASRILRKLGLSGLTIGTPDCMIAATALAYGQTLATLNTGHFSRIDGLSLADIT
jgi:predicted nucleic acid-binding protein